MAARKNKKSKSKKKTPAKKMPLWLRDILNILGGGLVGILGFGMAWRGYMGSADVAAAETRATTPWPRPWRRPTRPSTRRKLRRRALVERKIAELKMHGAGKARYRGSRKNLLQLRLTAGMVNMKKLFTLETGLACA